MDYDSHVPLGRWSCGTDPKLASPEPLYGSHENRCVLGWPRCVAPELSGCERVGAVGRNDSFAKMGTRSCSMVLKCGSLLWLVDIGQLYWAAKDQTM